jgi:hypothetical protein
MPFTTNPDRSDVPRSAARPLKYMDRYVTITQGEVFYMTEALAQLEGLERGPAGNTSLAAAFSIAQEMNEDEIIVVQETEYTGAGKHPVAQLNFAKENGIEIIVSNEEKEIPGKNIILPEHPNMIKAVDLDMNKVRRSYLKNMVAQRGDREFTQEELKYISDETRLSIDEIKSLIKN